MGTLVTTKFFMLQSSDCMEWGFKKLPKSGPFIAKLSERRIGTRIAKLVCEHADHKTALPQPIILPLFFLPQSFFLYRTKIISVIRTHDLQITGLLP